MQGVVENLISGKLVANKSRTETITAGTSSQRKTLESILPLYSVKK